MENYIITIARGYGSGGKEIAVKLAKALGIKYYDRELIRKASEQTGLSKRAPPACQPFCRYH